MNRTLLLAAMAGTLLACSTPGPDQGVPASDPSTQGWAVAHRLLGDWIDSTSSDTFIVHETWRAIDDSTLEGRGRVLAGGDTVFIEALRLAKRGGALIYSALPGGEANGTYTDFTCTRATGDTLDFVNAANDFPKRIRYVRDGRGWHASIDENAEGTQRAEHFRFLPR